MTALTDKQTKRLREHSKHHTPKHIADMKKSMRKGISFTRAHLLAKKK